jgi:redox-regulated HSP33 family molecular chaperone
MRRVLVLLPVVLLLAACGSKEEKPSVQVLPAAATADEWAKRVVDRLLRPTNNDIATLVRLNNFQTKLYIEEGNPDTLQIIRESMSDLAKCSDRLVTIGPPPESASDKGRLDRINTALHTACEHYVKVSKNVLDAVKLMSSGRADVIKRGEGMLADAVPDAQEGAKAYDEAVTTAQQLPEFRRNGLKPPA